MKHIQWFPGHMTKAMRMMEEQVKLVDGVLFILDARAPLATPQPQFRNPSLPAGPFLYILNKADLADEGKTAAFSARMEGAGEMNRLLHRDGRFRRAADRRAPSPNCCTKSSRATPQKGSPARPA